MSRALEDMSERADREAPSWNPSSEEEDSDSSEDSVSSSETISMSPVVGG